MYIESAKITLVKGDLQGIVKIKLSHAVMKNINQNLFCLFITQESNIREFYILLVFCFRQ
jgi:cation transport ATPase